MAINRAQAELTQTLNRSPTVADIADHLGVSEEAVLEGLEGGRAYRAVSLSTPLGDTLRRRPARASATTPNVSGRRGPGVSGRRGPRR